MNWCYYYELTVYLFTTYFFTYFFLPYPPWTYSHIHGLRCLKLQYWSCFICRSAKFTIFWAISLLVLFNGRLFVPAWIINKPEFKSHKVGFRCSYISIVFAVVKGFILAKNLWLTNLVSRYPSTFLSCYLQLKAPFSAIFSLFEKLFLSHQFSSLNFDLCIFLLYPFSCSSLTFIIKHIKKPSSSWFFPDIFR